MKRYLFLVWLLSPPLSFPVLALPALADESGSREQLIAGLDRLRLPTI